jgi:hypothetical protein
MPEFADGKEVAKRLRISEGYLRRLRIYQPELSPPFMKIGRRVLYPLTGPDSLETWAAGRVANRGARQ